MKQPKILLLAVIALLPLVSVSCIGAAQPMGGWSGPTVRDGIVYVGTRDGRVVAINSSTRTEQWAYTATSTIYTTPIVAGELVYVGTYSGQVYALTIDRGSERWVYPRTGSMGAIVGDPVIANETMYVSSSDGRVYALDTTYGDLRWKSEPLADKLWTSPVVVGDTLYVSTLDGHIYDLSLETGQSLGWSFKAEAGFASSPVVYEDHIYVGSFDRYLYAIEIGNNGSMWKFPQEEPAGNWFWASPIVNEGIVYAASLDGRLHGINATTGREMWSYTTKDQKDEPSPIVSSPVLMDNLLIVVNESGTVYVFDLGAEFGDEVVPSKTIPIGADVRSSLYAQDGLAYVRDENNKDNQLYVVDIDKGEVSWTFNLTEKEE
jgi:outer membrane protein assembly factor BamB